MMRQEKRGEDGEGERAGGEPCGERNGVYESKAGARGLKRVALRFERFERVDDAEIEAGTRMGVAQGFERAIDVQVYVVFRSVHA